jgi:FkbM family methyltransferase
MSVEKIKTVVEIGSNNGSHTMNFVNEENTFVWCFEPVPILFEQLKEKFKNYNNIKIFNNAISDFNGYSKFGISDPNVGAADYGCSSLNEFSDNIKDKWSNRPDFNFIETIDVEVIRMDKFILENNITEIDYFHCDAQGNDFKILKSFGDKLNIIKSGVVEASCSVSLYKVDNTAESIINFLEENEFKILNRSDLGASSPEIDINFEKI